MNDIIAGGITGGIISMVFKGFIIDYNNSVNTLYNAELESIKADELILKQQAELKIKQSEVLVKIHEKIKKIELLQRLSIKFESDYNKTIGMIEDSEQAICILRKIIESADEGEYKDRLILAEEKELEYHDNLFSELKCLESSFAEKVSKCICLSFKKEICFEEKI